MRVNLLLPLLILLAFASCKRDGEIITPQDGGQTTEQTGSITDMVVPDGFNYSVTSPVNFSFTTVDSTGAVYPNVRVSINGLDQGEDNGTIFSGISNESGLMEVELNVPNHFDQVMVITEVDNNIRYHAFGVDAQVSGQLKANGLEFNGSDADERGLNCYPEMSAVYSNDGKVIGVVSSKPILSINLHYTDNTNEVIPNTLGAISFSTNVGEICNDGIDNDGDGLIDCADPQCGGNVENCNGTIPCVSSFYQIVSKTIVQLDPTTGQYTHVGDLPDAFNVYNGSGYNSEDGYIYATGKDNATGKIYLVRIYGNANVTNLGEMVGFEGRSYTGDMDEAGNWTNFYYKDGTWRKASVDVSVSPPVFVTTPGIDVDGLGNIAHHDWVYNAVCDKFYTMQAGGSRILVADHKANPPTVEELATYSGLPSGAYGAAWADNEGSIYFSNNGTGEIFKFAMDNNCNPGSPEMVMQGSSTGNNDGMSCPYSPGIEFGGTDTDGDGITDQAEFDSGSNPANPCDPMPNSPTCNGGIYYSFLGGGSSGKVISYVELEFNCDAPPSHRRIYNDAVNNDIDGDGVPNDQDPDPLDPNETFVQYAPSASHYGTYAFEDLWPEQGDYDFNDFVVQVQEQIVTNSLNHIYEIRYKLRIMAMGGIFNNNFGITLPDPLDEAVTTIYSEHNTTHEVFQRDGREVIILKHPKAIFYTNDLINSESGAPYFEPKELEIVVKCNGSFTYPGSYDPTYFIEQHGISGHEIHMPGVQPTSAMNTGLFGTIHDDTNSGSNKFFLTATNLPWGLYVPTEWNYPQEGVEIINAYSDFDDYAQENPSLPWYNTTVSSNLTYTNH